MKVTGSIIPFTSFSKHYAFVCDLRSYLVLSLEEPRYVEEHQFSEERPRRVWEVLLNGFVSPRLVVLYQQYIHTCFQNHNKHNTRGDLGASCIGTPDS